MARTKTGSESRLEELRRISLKGFKAAKDGIDVEIRPLTLLAGQNSAGKSSLLQPLLLMKQTLEATHDPGVLELNGPCVKFNETGQLFWQGRSKRESAREWELTLETGAAAYEIQYERRSGGLGLVSTKLRRQGVPDVVLRADMTNAEKRAATDAAGWSAIQHELRAEVVVAEDRCAHRLEFQVERAGGMNSVFSFRPLPSVLLESLIHLPGLRGHPERSYPVTRAADRYPGVFPPYTASILLAWSETKDARLTEIGDDLAHLGLTWKVAPRRVDDTHVELKVGRLPRPQQGGAQDLVNIADVGFGASQVLPVVVALRAARPGQLVHIEQPELHLHPNAQVAMADLLLRAALRGVRVVVETHSSVLLKRIQVELAKEGNDVGPELVGLHWFTRDDEGVTRVTSAQVEDDGSYGAWPVDFADVEMKVEQDYIDAAVARNSGQ